MDSSCQPVNLDQTLNFIKTSYPDPAYICSFVANRNMSLKGGKGKFSQTTLQNLILQMELTGIPFATLYLV